jgi:hypothetical protein
MWPRIVECIVGCWLILSPFIFPANGAPATGTNDMVCGAAIVVLSMLSFSRVLVWAHYLIGVISLWLVGYAYFSFSRPGPPSAQNEIVAGLILLTFFLLPNDAAEPPASWRRFNQRYPEAR